MTTPRLEDLLPIALDMTASLSAHDRRERLVEAVRRVLPCDAVVLLRLERDDALVPVAAHGLSPDAMGRRFARAEHPRLDAICRSDAPVLFPADSSLPDPYDGLLIGAPHLDVHSCLGCPLRIEGRLWGVLTADALAGGAFDGVDRGFLSHLAALAAAAWRTSDLIEALQTTAERRGLVAQDLVHDVLERRGGVLLGNSAAMCDLRRELELVAGSDFPVLVTGETGVGKELVVRTLHQRSRRAREALVYVNCAALPESIVESELFGHEKGAFTGASEARPGKFRVADGASLFLDEVGELPLHVQPKLLRALQEGEVQAIGSAWPHRVDVRVFAATNRDLAAEVAAGRFRADLWHRLDVVRLRVPPLREHADDVPLLVGHFAERARRRLGTGAIRFAPEALDRLQRAPWPGNVRELENVVSRGVLRAIGRQRPGEPLIVRGGDLDDEVAPPPVALAPPAAGPSSPRLREAVEEFQRGLVRDALATAGGNWAAAARALGVDRSNLFHLARRLGLR
ncbi:MAG: nitric oxide reductase transcriptional regulator NorR [Planctomycetota bacterium]